MARTSDRDRIIGSLAESGGMSNMQLKASLDLADDRYKILREELIQEGLVEKYRCRGGGVALTSKGAKEASTDDYQIKSSVEKEKDLYSPFVRVLELEANENDENVVVCDTSSLRKRGRWSNPDITRVAVRSYPLLRKKAVVITTFEVKQWQKWDASAVYEAASHSRFSHESYVGLELPKGTDPAESIDGLRELCARFGVGIATIHQYYAGLRYVIRQDPEPKAPSDDYVEEYLTYVFERLPEQKARFEALMSATE